MTNQKSDDKKPFTPKKPSPFNTDPHNNRGGKGGNKGGSFVDNGSNKKMKSISVPKFKGGSGGDR